MNGVCGTTRLLGCYHLWPQVIPSPYTESVEIIRGDEYIVLGTDSLWKFVSYDEVVHEVQKFSDPIPAAKHLRDLAIAHGCGRDVSVVVIKLNLFNADQKIIKLRAQKVVTEPEDDEEEDEDEEEEEDEEEDEDVEFTNIDDILSDTEDDPSPPPASNWGRGQRSRGDEQTERREQRVEVSPLDDLDKLVLSAVSTPSSSPHVPSVESTNIDDLLLDDSPTAPGPRNGTSKWEKRTAPHLSPPYHKPLYKPGSNGVNAHHHKHMRVQSSFSSRSHSPSGANRRHRQQRNIVKVDGLLQSAPMEWDDDYPAQTLPKTKSIYSHQHKHTNGGITPLDENALTYEQTQSLPALGGESRRYSEGDTVGTHLAMLNKAMSHLDSELNPVPFRERPRGGTKIVRRLSYVEHSYHQLTRDTHSNGTVTPASNTVDVDDWAWT